ncbi:hypothetical protein BJQ90_00913 [Arthrobacter sp. SO3]|nr:hypothetical protein [Arthrobacter sp. SO3]
MGNASWLNSERTQVTVTHEPSEPRNWPDGHVGVALTGDELGECIEVTIHGVRHYLHSSTARELSDMLSSRIDEWNVTARAAGVPEV